MRKEGSVGFNSQSRNLYHIYFPPKTPPDKVTCWKWVMYAHHHPSLIHSSRSHSPLVLCPYPHYKSPTLALALALTGLGLDLGLSTASSLLADDTLGLALGSSGALGLIGLLGGGSGGLLLLGLLDGCGAGGVTSLGSHRSLLLDHIERGTDDGTLGLDGAARALLGDFL